MATEDVTGMQTRAMTEAQCIENENENQREQTQDTNQVTQGPARNTTVDLHKDDDDIIKEFIRRQGIIALDWYVPDLRNTQIGTLISQRLQIETTRGRILFNCPPLSETFHTSIFELDLTTGRVYTYLNPPEDIGVPCQKEPFDLELLTKKLQSNLDTSESHMEELQRIPLVWQISWIWRKLNSKFTNIVSCGDSILKFQ